MKTHSYYNDKFFAKWAWLYDYEKYVTLPLRKTAAGLLHSYIKPCQKILDVATGTGLHACECAKLGHHVVGIDLSQEMLRQAKKKCNPNLKLQFLHGDATKLPYDESTFDASTISFGLHDMPFEIRLRVLREMQRVTKPDGFLLFTDYIEPSRSLFNSLAYRIERILETPMFEDFVQRGLMLHLSTVQLKPIRHIMFLKLVHIVLCKNSKRRV